MRSFSILMFTMLASAAAAAQDVRRSDVSPTEQPEMTPVQPALDVQRLPSDAGRSTPSQVGQRQTREQIARDAGIEPMARINARIQNRVQSRIRNRIDRDYNPQANAVSPFAVAGDQLRVNGQQRQH